MGSTIALDALYELSQLDAAASSECSEFDYNATSVTPGQIDRALETSKILTNSTIQVHNATSHFVFLLLHRAHGRRLIPRLHSAKSSSTSRFALQKPLNLPKLLVGNSKCSDVLERPRAGCPRS